MPRVTLITDASFHSPGVAGWAGWARADGMESRRWEGRLRAPWITYNTDAEMAATALGLGHVAKQYAPGHDVLVQSDCWRVLALLRSVLGAGENKHPLGMAVPSHPLPKGPTLAEGRLLEAIDRLQIGCIVVRHVKGHRDSERQVGRYRTNCALDEAAKRQMRGLREELGLPPQLPGRPAVGLGEVSL